MLKKIILVIIIVLSFKSFAQNYEEQFNDICQEGKLREAKQFLDEWEKAEPNNPEMFVGLFNYYLIESESRLGNPNFLDGYIIAVDKDSIPLDKILKLNKESDSLFQIAQNYLDEGIIKNPNRFDMYIGRSNTLNERRLYSKFVTSVESIIIQLEKNKGQWLWANNEPYVKTENEFVGIIQGYINQMFNFNNPVVKDIEDISHRLLKIFPENYILLSNIGICKLEVENYQEAIYYFNKGLQSKPEDLIIRFNLADTYIQLKQFEKAKEYYNYIIEHGDEQYSNYAKDLLSKFKRIRSKSGYTSNFILA